MLTVDPGGGAWAWCSTWLPAAAWTGRAETPASRPLPPGADSGSKNSPELSGTRTPSLLGRSPRQVLSCCRPLPIFPRPWLWALAPGACAGRWGRSSSCPRPGVRSPEGPPSLRGRSCWELEQVLGRDGWGRFGRPGLTAARAPWTPSRRQEVTPAASRARGGGTQTPHWGPGSSVLTGSSPGRAGVPRVNWLSKPRPGPGRAVQGRAGEDCVPGGEGGLPGGGSQGPSRPNVCSRERSSRLALGLSLGPASSSLSQQAACLPFGAPPGSGEVCQLGLSPLKAHPQCPYCVCQLLPLSPTLLCKGRGPWGGAAAVTGTGLGPAGVAQC